MTPEMALAASRWWGKHLRGTEAPIDQTAVDRVDAGLPQPGMVNAIRSRMRDRQRTPEHQAKVDVFERTLTEFLTLPSWPKDMNEYGRDAFPTNFILHNEYSPFSAMLVESLNTAGIGQFSLPIKTRMIILRDTITVQRDDRSIEVVWDEKTSRESARHEPAPRPCEDCQGSGDGPFGDCMHCAGSGQKHPFES